VSSTIRRFSFSRRARLLSPKEFDRVFRKGKRSRQSLLTVIAANNDLGFPRLGMVAARNVGKAHQRNRAKRNLRETFRLDLAPDGPGVDIVVRLLPDSGTKPSRKVRDEFLKAAAELGLLPEPIESDTPEQTQGGES